MKLHDGGRCPVSSFWWGKQQVVSVCSPQAFKDTVKLTDRASEWNTVEPLNNGHIDINREVVLSWGVINLHRKFNGSVSFKDRFFYCVLYSQSVLFYHNNKRVV